MPENVPQNRKRDESRPHVLIATNALTGGGAQRSNMQIALGLAQNGFLTSILSVRPHDGAGVVTLDSSTSLYNVNEVRWPRWTRAPHVLRHILRVVRDEDVDLIIAGSFGLNQTLLAARALGMLRCPLIVVEHLGIRFRLDVLSRSNSFVATIFRHVLSWLYRHATKVVAVSEGVANEFQEVLRLPPNAVMRIYNGVDRDAIVSEASARPETKFAEHFDKLSRPIVITAGRLEAQKAHDDLVRAFARLPDAMRGSLVILGEGSRRDSLTSLSKELGLHASVHLPGHVENPWWFISKSDVFALSSHFEGFGLVLIEALACNVPIVSTDCPSGPREILQDVEQAQLVPVGDPKAFSDALHLLLQSARLDPRPRGPYPSAASAAGTFSTKLNAERFTKLVEDSLFPIDP